MSANRLSAAQLNALNAGRASRKGRRFPQLQHKVAAEVLEAIVRGVSAVGSDGAGRDGLLGYIQWAARESPTATLTALTRLAIHFAPPPEPEPEPEVTYRSLEEVKAECRRRGLPDHIFLPADYNAVEPPVLLPKDAATVLSDDASGGTASRAVSNDRIPPR